MSERQYVAAGFAVPEGLQDVHDLLERVAAEHPDVPANDLMLFETAVVEIVGNIVEHVGAAGTTTWTFTLAVTSTELRGLLADNGEAFEDESSEPSLPEDLLAESGRGLALTRAVLDELEYARVGDTNHWLLVRSRNDATG